MNLFIYFISCGLTLVFFNMGMDQINFNDGWNPYWSLPCALVTAGLATFLYYKGKKK